MLILRVCQFAYAKICTKFLELNDRWSKGVYVHVRCMRPNIIHINIIITIAKMNFFIAFIFMYTRVTSFICSSSHWTCISCFFIIIISFGMKNKTK